MPPSVLAVKPCKHRDKKAKHESNTKSKTNKLLQKPLQTNGREILPQLRSETTGDELAAGAQASWAFNGQEEARQDHAETEDQGKHHDRAESKGREMMNGSAKKIEQEWEDETMVEDEGADGDRKQDEEDEQEETESWRDFEVRSLDCIVLCGG